MANENSGRQDSHPTRAATKHSPLWIFVALIIIVIAVVALFLSLGTHSPKTPISTNSSHSTTTTNSTTTTSTTTSNSTTTTPISASSSGSGTLAGTEYYYASSVGHGNLSATAASGTSFICEASVACSNGIQNYSWMQDTSDRWCDTYSNCGEFDSIGHQSSDVCSLGVVNCPYPNIQQETVGAIGIQTSQSYTLFRSTSSPLSYNVSNSTSLVVITVACVHNGINSCSIPNIPSGCTKLFMTSYGNKTGYSAGPATIYGAMCSSQKAGKYAISIQNYTYYTAAAYVYHS